MDNQELGRLGERIACEYIASKGYKILEMNFRKHWGEIDIVAQEGETLVFVEVKTRMEYDSITPEQSITKYKIKNLTNTALFYKRMHKELPELLRLDFVGVVLKADLSVVRINLIRNISN